MLDKFKPPVKMGILPLDKLYFFAGKEDLFKGASLIPLKNQFETPIIFLKLFGRVSGADTIKDIGLDVKRLQIIEKYDDFLKLIPHWNELVSNSEVDHAFMKHQWFAAWIKAHDISDNLAVITLWSDEQLVAAAPVYRTKFNLRGLRFNGLSLITSGLSPRCNFILSDIGLADELLHGVMRLRNWDLFYLQNMQADAEPTHSLIEFLRDEKIPFQQSRGFHSPYLEFDGSWDQFWESLPGERRKYLTKKCIRRLEKADSYEVKRILTAEEFKNTLPIFYKLSEKSWKADIDSNLRPGTPLAKLLEDFTPFGLENGLVRIYLLLINNEVVGFEYQLVHANRYSVVRTDYDEDYKYFTPGNSLRVNILKDLFSEKTSVEYDLGGNEDPYKLEWCDKIRKHLSITVANKTLKGRAVLAVKNSILPAMRNIFPHKKTSGEIQS